jgi:polysaccharide chain length determinant protein (PEP-CTERM system associated)
MVTNKLASLFIEENLKMREQQAQGTSEFLAIELDFTKVQLEQQEKNLTEFKRKFMGELPEQRDANLRVLDQLQLQSQRINDSLKGALDRRVIIQKQLSDFELLASSANQAQRSAEELLTGIPSSSPTARAKNPYETQLEQMKNYLVELQAKYTDKHPDISITRKKIADLEVKRAEFDAAAKAEAEKEEQEKPATKDGLPAKTPPGKRELKMDPRLTPRYKEIENQLIAVDMEIGRLKQEDATVKTQISQYRERIENTPGREQAMALLTRDYNNTRESYSSLLKKSQDAQQAENLERRQKGEQFKIIDPARIPEKPYKPDIPKILLIGLVLSLGAGVAAVFFREQMDRSFRDAEDLHVTFGLKVLANIPRIDTKTG